MLWSCWKMNVLISGASGLVGQALVAELSAHGHSPIPLLRGKMWDPISGDLHLTEAVPPQPLAAPET
jgi:nucleoside-diphosphate-sugar epimerase